MNKSLPKRYEVIESLAKSQKYTLGVELGVAYGETLKYIEHKCPKLQWIGVDAYDNSLKEKYRDYNFNPNAERYIFTWDFKTWKPDIEAFCQSSNKTSLMCMKDIEAVKWFDDNSIDIVFIDLDHSYECIRRNVKSWLPKLKPNGIFFSRCWTEFDTQKTFTELFNKIITIRNEFCYAKKMWCIIEEIEMEEAWHQWVKNHKIAVTPAARQTFEELYRKGNIDK